jgi:hypothetical protein
MKVLEGEFQKCVMSEMHGLGPMKKDCFHGATLHNCPPPHRHMQNLGRFLETVWRPQGGSPVWYVCHISQVLGQLGTSQTHQSSLDRYMNE